MEGMESAESTTATPESASVDTSTTTEAEVSSNTPSPSADAGSEGSSSKGDIRVVVDAKGNRHVEMTANPFDTDTEKAEEEVAAEPPQEEQSSIIESEPQPQPQYYADMNEIVSAAALGVLDENRLTAEQRNTLAQIQQQEQQKMAQVQAMEQARLQADTARKQAFGNIAVQAKQQALQALGITENDLANADYVENGNAIKDKYQEAYNNLVLQGQTNYIRQEVAMEQQRATFNNSLKEIREFCSTEKTKEPHYDEILTMMDNIKETMPYRDAKAIIQAEQNYMNGTMNLNDVSVFRKYYDYCKKQAYQKANNVSTTPRKTNTVPKVEQSGQPHGSQQRQGLDIKAIRGMNSYQRSQAMTQYIKSIM